MKSPAAPALLISFLATASLCILPASAFSSRYTWTAHVVPGHTAFWSSITSSSDGEKLAAVGNGDIYTSTDGGATWTNDASTDGGETWTNDTTGTALSGLDWTSITSSSDGTDLAAEAGRWNGSTYEADIYTSANGGATWTKQQQAYGPANFGPMTSSSNGMDLAIIETAGNYGTSTDGGDIYTSTDGGATWTDQTAAGSRQWTSITSSSNGEDLAATVDGGDIYISTDGGATWTEQSVVVNAQA